MGPWGLLSILQIPIHYRTNQRVLIKGVLLLIVIIKEWNGGSPMQFKCESVPVLIACALLVVVLPVVPVPRLLLLPVIHLLLLAVAILLVRLRLLLLPLHPLQHVLVLQLPHLLQGHRGLVGVLLPHLRHQVLPLLGGSHALVDVLLGRHVPHLDLGDGLS